MVCNLVYDFFVLNIFASVLIDIPVFQSRSRNMVLSSLFSARCFSLFQRQRSLCIGKLNSNIYPAI